MLSMLDRSYYLSLILLLFKYSITHGQHICIGENNMATATERIPVLITSLEKKRIVNKAKKAGMKTSQFMRLAAESYQPDKDEEALSSMIDQMNIATANASKSIDGALKFVELSNKRIDKMEAEAKITP